MARRVTLVCSESTDKDRHFTSNKSVYIDVLHKLTAYLLTYGMLHQQHCWCLSADKTYRWQWPWKGRRGSCMVSQLL